MTDEQKQYLIKQLKARRRRITIARIAMGFYTIYIFCSAYVFIVALIEGASAQVPFAGTNTTVGIAFWLILLHIIDDQSQKIEKIATDNWDIYKEIFNPL